MKNQPIAVLIFGHDKGLQETRQWVLQTRGYRAAIALDLNTIEAHPRNRAVDLLLICHSIGPTERDAAIALAQSRWPGSRHLSLTAEQGRMPDGILGQLLHTMDGPARLISLVGLALQEPAQNKEAPPRARAS